MLMALLFAGAMNFFMYFASSKMVLRMYGAQVVTAAEAPELYAMVDRLRQRAGLPMPTVAIAPHAQPNAFATGRNPEHAVVCVTEGILRLVSREELEGVLAHELAHIKNRDMLLQTFTATMAGAISNLAHLGLFFGGRDDDEGGNPVVGIADGDPRADRRDAHAVGDQPAARVQGGRGGRARSAAVRSRSRARCASWSGRAPHPDARVARRGAARAGEPARRVSGGGMAKLFSTHPPTAERVARLQALAA